MARRDSLEEPIYGCGVQWEDIPLAIDELAERLPPAGQGREKGIERRASPRLLTAGRANLEFMVASSVRVVDISGSGALIGSAIPLPVGTKGSIRLRLGESDFSGDVAVRRVAGHDGTKAAWRMGVTFGALDERSSQSLWQLLGRKAGSA